MDLDFTFLDNALKTGDRVGLCAALTRSFAGDPEVGLVEAFVRYGLDGTEIDGPVSPNTRVFLDSIRETRRILAGAQAPVIHRRSIGPDLDFLGDSDGVGSWSLSQCLNHLLLCRIPPTKTAAVVGTMRDDGIYILEWVAHYRVLGFDRLYVYTNDNADGSEVLLRVLADHGVITLIESETSGRVRPERKAFEHALHVLQDLRDHAWVLFVDSDEYLEPAPRFDRSITRVLAALADRYPETSPAAICYEWLWFVSGMIYERRHQLLLERFQYATPHTLTKSLVRLSETLSMRQEHFPEVKPGGFLVDSEFARFPANSLWNKTTTEYGGGWVKHYWARSFEEFSVKKARGATLTLENNEYDRDFRLFFDWNAAETPDIHRPTDPELLRLIRQEILGLRQLDGVAAAARQVDALYPSLLRRYDELGGLRRLYVGTLERVRQGR